MGEVSEVKVVLVLQLTLPIANQKRVLAEVLVVILELVASVLDLICLTQVLLDKAVAVGEEDLQTVEQQVVVVRELTAPLVEQVGMELSELFGD
jgi:hypothetical protein